MSYRPQYKPPVPCRKDPSCKRPSGYNTYDWCAYHWRERDVEQRKLKAATERSRAVREDCHHE